MRQETEESMAKALQNGQKYDESCKEVFKNREVIAPILKYVVSEFKDCTQEEIIRCIDVTPSGRRSRWGICPRR